MSFKNEKMREPKRAGRERANGKKKKKKIGRTRRTRKRESGKKRKRRKGEREREFLVREIIEFSSPS